MRKFLIIFILFVFLASPTFVRALNIGELLQGNKDSNAFTAESYVVIDDQTGQIVMSKNSTSPWVPASITKLITALVVLDTKPNLNKSVAINSFDQSAGGCNEGGACLYTKLGVSYKVKDLFYASLVASANNATHALSRSTGLTEEQFVKRMNNKAKELGAVNTTFYEPTGMDPKNTTTAEDYAKITFNAFSNQFIHEIAVTSQYKFSSTNNKRYIHTIKNTNKLLGDSDVQVIGGKTGYLDESRYNFVSVLKDRFENEFTIVVMGSKNGAAEFSETKQLLSLAGLSKSFNLGLPGVLGASTKQPVVTIN
jgi:D-alanyl-D-alanine carboxypeptidase